MRPTLLTIAALSTLTIGAVIPDEYRRPLSDPPAPRRQRPAPTPPAASTVPAPTRQSRRRLERDARRKAS